MAGGLPQWVRVTRIVILILLGMLLATISYTLLAQNDYERIRRHDSSIILLVANGLTLVVIIGSFDTQYWRYRIFAPITLGVINALWVVGWAWNLEQVVWWWDFLSRLGDFVGYDFSVWDWAWIICLIASAILGFLIWCCMMALLIWSVRQVMAKGRNAGTASQTSYEPISERQTAFA